MSTRVMLAVAALVSVPMIAGAQTGQTGKTGQPGQTGQTGKTPQPAHPGQKPGDTTTVSMVKGPFVHSASELMGMKVQNPQGEELGKIEDVVLYSNGEIAYVVLSHGGVLGMGDKLFAIPFNLFHTRADGLVASRTDRTDRDDHLILAVDKERLKAAPGFDKDKWPSEPNATLFADVDKYYASEKRPATARPMEASARTATTLTLRASALKGKNVESPTGDKIGDIKDVVIDPGNARVTYAVLSVGGFLGMGDRHIAVPWEALKLTRDGDKEKLVLATTKEKLQQAPEFKMGEASWHEMSDPIWIGRVYEFYAIRPYWSDASATPAPGAKRTDPTDRTDKDKDDKQDD